MPETSVASAMTSDVTVGVVDDGDDHDIELALITAYSNYVDSAVFRSKKLG